MKLKSMELFLLTLILVFLTGSVSKFLLFYYFIFFFKWNAFTSVMLVCCGLEAKVSNRKSFEIKRLFFAQEKNWFFQMNIIVRFSFLKWQRLKMKEGDFLVPYSWCCKIGGTKEFILYLKIITIVNVRQNELPFVFVWYSAILSFWMIIFSAFFLVKWKIPASQSNGFSILG